MLFQLIICAIALLVLADIAHAAPQPPSPLQRKYDQMQSGDFNVRVNLKDVKVIALLGGGTGLDLGDDYMVSGTCNLLSIIQMLFLTASPP